MRTRDLKKLKPGTKVKVTLTKGDLLDAPYLKPWTIKPVYFHGELLNVSRWFEIGTNKKLSNSTKIEPFEAKELSLVKE